MTKMKYQHFRSLLAASKRKFNLQTESGSFRVYLKRSAVYIEPEFEKIIFESEKPTIILVSAVGATGKTALAKQLSLDTALPVLDLSSHKPVGDNTLTGVLTGSFPVANISEIFQCLRDASFGLVVDGLDEGRAKTTAKGFEAFLDDIVKLTGDSDGTSVVMLGRTQILDDCWEYLTRAGKNTALITIAPFSMDGARKFIDAFSGASRSTPSQQYDAARDLIINRLSSAFKSESDQPTDDFLAFIGYPPVLDAIATLLKEEKNHHKLIQQFDKPDDENIEIALLRRISTYILERERLEKVVPNILEPLLSEAPESMRAAPLKNAFSAVEQSARLVGYCQGQTINVNSLGDSKLNERYENQLLSFLPEHPFLNGTSFRNAVFEALALAMLMASKNQAFKNMVSEYSASRKHSYHLVYMFDSISIDHQVDPVNLSNLISSALEFRSAHSIVEVRIEGQSWEEQVESERGSAVEIEIELLLGDEVKKSKTFVYRLLIPSGQVLSLGAKLASTFVSIPCGVKLGTKSEIELTAPIALSAKDVHFDAQSLTLRPNAISAEEKDIVVNCTRVKSILENVTTNTCNLIIACEDRGNLTYPLIQHVVQRTSPPADPLIKQKYFRLKRILMELRSHSRGSLARYKGKIEHQRVLKNETGRDVLKKLLEDGILSLKGDFYHLDPAALHQHLGISWQDLRQGLMPDSMLEYLRRI